MDLFDKNILAAARITKEELLAIKNDFLSKEKDHELAAQSVLNILLKATGVHSARYRVKDGDHLIEKIIRKKTENEKRIITLENYETELTDLSGVRVIHLFKDELSVIHDFIMNSWDVIEKPTAYYRKGDSEEVVSELTELGCEAQVHKAGYRSVHYIIEHNLTKQKKYIVEIQVRTIFEEGWSEVDHKIRYPNFSNNPLTNQLLLILNRLAGTVDEMSSFIQVLYSELSKSSLSDSNSTDSSTITSQEITEVAEIINNFQPLSTKDAFTPLAYLLKYQIPQTSNTFETTIESIEALINQSLPEQAYNSLAWWTDYSAHSRQWLLTGWRVDNVHLESKKITFCRWSHYINMADQKEVAKWSFDLGIPVDKLKGIIEYTGPLSTVISDYIKSNKL